MALPNVNITKQAGGLGRRAPSQDMVSGLVMNGISVTSGAQTGTVYVFNQLKDAEDLGLTADYDDTNSVLVHYHIKEFFRMNDSGKLWLLLLPQTASGNPLTIDKMVDKSNSDYAKKLLVEAQGEIRQLGVAMNPGTGYSSTNTNGLDDTVESAISKAQALVDEENAQHRPVQIALEGRDFDESASPVLNLRDLSSDAKNVSVTIAQDKAIGDDKSRYSEHAALGTLLGTISLANVHENIGWLQRFDIQDVATSSFVKAGLSSNKLVSSYTDTDLDSFNTNGYIFPLRYTGIDGVYFNDSHTCIEVSSDFAYIENNRTIDKAVRRVREALLPKLKGPLYVDPDSGQLSQEVTKAFEADAGEALNGMLQDEELSGKDEYVDPDQDVLATSKLEVNIALIPVGVGRQIDVIIGFDNPA